MACVPCCVCENVLNLGDQVVVAGKKWGNFFLPKRFKTCPSPGKKKIKFLANKKIQKTPLSIT